MDYATVEKTVDNPDNMGENLGSIMADFAAMDLYEDDFLKDLEAGLNKVRLLRRPQDCA